MVVREVLPLKMNWGFVSPVFPKHIRITLLPTLPSAYLMAVEMQNWRSLDKGTLKAHYLTVLHFRMHSKNLRA